MANEGKTSPCQKVKIAAARGALNNKNIFTKEAGMVFEKTAIDNLYPLLDRKDQFLVLAAELISMKEVKSEMEKKTQTYNAGVAYLIIHSRMKDIDDATLMDFLVEDFSERGTALSDYVKDKISKDTEPQEAIAQLLQYPNIITDDDMIKFITYLDEYITSEEEIEEKPRGQRVVYGERGTEERPTAVM